ncbi:hypothetical protein AN218_31310 [Streptomyces nanshensis]|uniref:Uncharacterized protein n=1 Tax=Streptomyces nanshensis TaxID=518642 RepID=A0A1E7KPI8_9ACTN|nr:hypothetical protein AN218_31310 [Streptomyces nanshensis]
MIHASWTSYGTTLTSEAALIMPSCPFGRPPPAPPSPAPPSDSDAWSAPVTRTSPRGGAGTREGSASPGSHPRTTGSALAWPPGSAGRTRSSEST